MVDETQDEELDETVPTPGTAFKPVNQTAKSASDKQRSEKQSTYLLMPGLPRFKWSRKKKPVTLKPEIVVSEEQKARDEMVQNIFHRDEILKQTRFKSSPAGFKIKPLGPAPKNTKLPMRLLYGVLTIGFILGVGLLITFWIKGPTKKDEVSTGQPTVVEKKDISQLSVGMIDVDLTNFYPNPSTSLGDVDINRQIFEPLVAVDMGGKATGVLAQSWERENDTTWVFTIKSNVTFHSKRQMTAEDVKESLLRAKIITGLNIYADTIKSVEVVSDQKIKIQTQTTDPQLLVKLSRIFIFDQKSDKTIDAINGTGPYTTTALKSVDNSELQLEAFSNYHGSKVYVQKLTFKRYDTNDQLKDALQKNEVQVTGELAANELSGDRVKQITETKLKNNTAYFLLMSSSRVAAPLNSLDMRKIVARSISASKLIEQTKLPADTLSQFAPKSVIGYDAALSVPRPDDVAAKKDFESKTGENGLSLKMVYRESDTALADRIEQQLSSIGFDITSTAKPDSQIYVAAKTNSYDIVLLPYVYPFGDIANAVNDLFLKNSAVGAMYENSEVASTLSTSRNQLDEKTRTASLRKLNKLLVESVAAVPIFEQTTTLYAPSNAVLKQQYVDGYLGVYFSQIAGK